MKRNGLRRLAALGAMLALAASFGCSPLPTAPPLATNTTPKGGVQLLRDDDDEGEDGRIRLPDDPREIEPVEPVDSAEKMLPGVVGGVVAAGKVTVEVPAGAFDGMGMVKVTVLDSVTRHCRLEITPGGLNHFDVPVKLTFDCSDFTYDELRRSGVQWFNPVEQQWVQVDTYMDFTKGTVSARLEHFSEYKCEKPKPGKASW